MSLADALRSESRPSRVVSLGVSAALVGLWAAVRLAIFQSTIFPLTYAIPLLVCVWTRDRLALWSMAAIFAAMHTAKLFWLFPADALTSPDWWGSYVATLLNIGVGAAVVNAIIGLRERLERALGDVRAQAEELRAQGEELAQQNEELAEQTEELSHQTEELSQQGEELAAQNEELQSQAEEIAALNEALERRETLLQALLETARVSGSEGAALQHIAAAAIELFDGIDVATAVYEKTAAGLAIRAVAAEGAGKIGAGSMAADDFVELVLSRDQTASLSDVSLRPDLSLAALGGRSPAGAVLCAPVRVAGAGFGAFAVYSRAAHEWTDEEFRLAEWLAEQCGRVLQTLRVQSDLREADQRKSEFLATLSHELRNPLAPIGFGLKLLEAGNGSDPNAIRIMRRQLQQLVRLVDDLLDATRLSSNKIQIRRLRTDLVPIVQHAVEACMPDIEAARHELAITVPAEPVWVDADPDRLAQVVTNLLNNATRYTPPGGRLTLDVGVAEEEVVLSVSDTGVGLDDADRERVFEMFMQVGGPGSGGLGIGLALVRRIVELHGGRVEARSEGPGRGSEFAIRLPLA